jgi:hypothetical protein
MTGPLVAFASRAFVTSALVASGSAPSLSPELLVPPPDEARGDAVYQRLDGDLALGLSPLVEFDPSRGHARPAFLATLRFYQTLGVVAGLSQAVDGEDPLERRILVGVTIEPLFLLRWTKYGHSGQAFWDLTLDSFGVHLGAAFDQPRFEGVRPLANLGGGFGLPLMGSAKGLWVRTRIDVELGESAPAVLCLAGLEWQFLFESPWTQHSSD